MRSRHFFITSIIATVTTFVLVLSVAGCIPPDNAGQIDSHPAAQDARVERGEAQVDAAAPDSAAAESAPSQAAPTPDGPALIKSHCSGCHVVTQFDQIEKQRPEWEMALSSMEAMGVHLSDAEKGVLLDYLSIADKP
jgi:outer membrane murein-binding lipoprotein Lpp